ncbi:HAMP domain-containing histidine kinase [Candidatus Dojkabacteria bacterium]|nr:HAMP domain-containing histidine kinase [Candidatus Dojkabacteria bacterium]
MSAQIIKLQKLANKAEFSAGLSHEIATPLTCVKTNLEIIKTRQDPEKFIDGALIGLEQIDLILNNYLRLNKQNGFSLRFNPNDEIVKAVRLLNFKIRRNKVKVHFDLRSREIYGNPVEFNQVVANLISNSVDAYDEITAITDKGTRRINIISRMIKNMYILKIVDFGIGIPEENSRKIFRSYFTTKPFEFGTGLGLSVSRKIIQETFRGNLELSSNKNPTIFTIKIPVDTTD